MDPIVTPPAEAPVVPVAPVVEPLAVTPEINGTEGQESNPEDLAPDTAEVPGESDGTPTLAADDEDPFLAESTLPAEQLAKIKAAFGDGALEIVGKLEQVQGLEAAFGEIPSVEFVQSLAEGQMAIGQLFTDLEKNPDQALNYFLLDEKGGFDARGAQFIGALADGVRRGTVPDEARMPIAHAVFSSAMVDVNSMLYDLDREIKYAEGQGMDSKANDLRLKMGEQEIIKDFLNQFLGMKVPVRGASAARDPERVKFEAEKAEFAQQKLAQSNQRMSAIETQQGNKYQAIADEEVAKFTSKIPASVSTSLKEAALRGAKIQLKEVADASDRQKYFAKHYQNAMALAQSNGAGAREAFEKATNAYRNMLQVAVAQVYGPMLKDLGVTIEAKGKAIVDARKAGEQKLGAPPVAATVGQVEVPKDWNWDITKESRKEYTDRMFKVVATR